MSGNGRESKGIPARLRPVLAACFWLLVWQALSLLCSNRFLLAGPWETLLALLAALPTLSFWSSILFSLARIVLGFLLALVLGLALGAVAWRHPGFRTLMQPLVAFVKAVPVVCIIVLLLIWVGSAWVSVIVVFMMAFAAWYYACIEALDHVDASLDQMLKGFKVTGLRRVLALHWPSMLPFLRSAAQTVVGMSWKAGIAAEVIGIPSGSIGERIYAAKITLETGDLFAWMLVIVALALACEKLFLLLLDGSAGWSSRIALALPARKPAPAEPCDIRLEGVCKAFGQQQVLDGLDLALSAGESLAIRGASGLGKTTLLDIICGDQVADKGLVKGPVRSCRVYQDARLLKGLSAVDNLRLASNGVLSANDARDFLLQLLPDEALDKPTEQLSGGQQRKVELCRALAIAGDALVFDEPFAGLDAESVQEAVALIAREKERRTLLLVTHGDEASALEIPEYRI